MMAAGMRMRPKINRLIQTKRTSEMKSDQRRKPIVLSPGAGREYDMGPMKAMFKADNAETAQSYSISEWWLEPKTKGPGTHSHEYDHAYYILAGTMSVSVDGKWMDCERGSFVMIPSGTPHDFENRSAGRSGMLSFNNVAGFESEMPGIVSWFEQHPIERIP
jgi:mannose-6-phosphate isomerase-like protein (cupin superfamily)